MDDFRRALDKGLRLVARREVCRRQVIERLREEFGEDTAEAVADELARQRLVDDSRFARLYAAQLYEKGFYIRRVVYELKSKGVDGGLAEETAYDLAPDQEESILRLLGGKLGSELADAASLRRAMNTFERYGYDGDTVLRVIREFQEGGCQVGEYQAGD